MPKNTIVHNYEKIVGKTVKKVVNISDEIAEGFLIEFTDGTALLVTGNASGHDVEYSGLYYKFVEMEDTNPSLTFEYP